MVAHNRSCVSHGERRKAPKPSISHNIVEEEQQSQVQYKVDHDQGRRELSEAEGQNSKLTPPASEVYAENFFDHTL